MEAGNSRRTFPLACNNDTERDSRSLYSLQSSPTSISNCPIDTPEKCWNRSKIIFSRHNSFINGSKASIKSSFSNVSFDTKRTEINWQNDLTLSENTDFTVGINHRKTDASITGFSTFDGDITNNAIYANMLNHKGKFNLDLSGRYDDHSQAGGEFTGQVATGYSFTPNTTAYISYGTAFRAPNINDLYNPGSPSFSDPTVFQFAGNPDLKPETSKSFEVGLKADFPESNLRVNLAAHHTITEDFQSNVFIGNGFALQNAGDYEADGIEVESLWIPIQGTRLLLAYSYTDAVFKTFEQGPCWSSTPWQTGTPDPKQQFLPNGAPAPYCDRSGDRPYTQPKTKGVLTLEQEFSLSDDIYSYVAIEFSYVGDIYTEASGDEIALIDARNAINARVFFNLEEYDMDIVLWGRNIGDDAELSSQSLAAPLQQGKLLNFYKEPATYGVSVKKRF